MLTIFTDKRLEISVYGKRNSHLTMLLVVTQNIFWTTTLLYCLDQLDIFSLVGIDFKQFLDSFMFTEIIIIVRFINFNFV